MFSVVPEYALVPLCDRNPQTFVPNILFAQASDYRAQTYRIMVSGPDKSFIELPVVHAQ